MPKKRITNHLDDSEAVQQVLVLAKAEHASGAQSGTITVSGTSYTWEADLDGRIWVK